MLKALTLLKLRENAQLIRKRIATWLATNNLSLFSASGNYHSNPSLLSTELLLQSQQQLQSGCSH